MDDEQQYNPLITLLEPWEDRLIAERERLRAVANFWRGRAVQAEERVEELQRRLNDKLAEGQAESPGDPGGESWNTP